MEDVINGCPKKQPTVEREQTRQGGAQLVRASADGLLHISYDVVNASMICRPTTGDAVLVRWNDETCQGVEAYREGDTLYVKAQNVTSGGWLSRLVTFVGSRTDVTIEIPNGAKPSLRARSLSGDLDVQDVELTEADFNTTSGDITLCPLSGSKLASIVANTASGDVEVRANADKLAVRSMSGDVEAISDCAELNVSSVSGDVNVRSDCVDAVVKSVSGDTEVEATNPALKRMQVSSTSGDVNLRLRCDSINLHTSTVSGSVRSNIPNPNDANASAQVSVSSVSGDVNVSR